MIPIRDENPTHRTPVLTVAFIIICVVVYIIQFTASGEDSVRLLYQYGFVPAFVFGSEQLPPGAAAIPAWASVFTSMFMHGSWLHLGGNMLFLWIFGNNIEDALGHARFILFYLGSGIAAALGQAFVNINSDIPMVGASGAIAGVLGAYILLYPHARVVTLIFLGFFITTMRVPAFLFLGLWFAMQWINALMTGAAGSGVAWWAHIGGFVAGVVLLFFLKPVQVKRHRRGPWG